MIPSPSMKPFLLLGAEKHNEVNDFEIWNHARRMLAF